MNLAAPADLAVPAGLVVLAPVGRVVRADLGNTQAVPVDLVVLRVGPADLVVPAVLGITQADLVAQVDLAGPETTDLADLVVPETTDLAGPAAARVDLAGPAARAGLGTGMPSVATSTTPRGATDPHLGERANRHVLRGTGRCRPQVGRGTMARSTTTATRRHRSGIPGLTSLASTSSGSGSRCKESVLRDARFATWRGGRRAVGRVLTMCMSPTQQMHS
jgi:hypothetical protein